MMTNAVRNPDGIWINSNLFREEALHFEKYGYYCPYAWGSKAWEEYWLEQRKRCIEGYEVGGVRIPGNFYFYLNFTQIKAIDKKTKKKTVRFPDFWDGDYNYFWALEIAEKGISYEEYLALKLSVKIKKEHLGGSRHMMVAKARRKGFSWKSAAVLANAYHNVKYSLNLIGSFDKKYSKDAYNKTKTIIGFVDDHTGFRKNRIIDTREHLKSGFVDPNTGSERGYLSEVIMLTYQDNPDAARGKDAYKIILEEMGTFPNAIDAYSATVDSVKDGEYTTGQMIMYGTSSNKEAMTEPFKEMFYNPDVYDILPFVNIWDENSEDTECGFFFPVYQNKQGYYDENGNTDIKAAIESELKIREKKKVSSTALNNYVTENPFSPEEAFRSGAVNIFPVQELTRQLKIVLNKKLYLSKGQPVNIYMKDGKVYAEPILDLKHREPIYFYKQNIDDTAGVPIIYEYPINNAPRGLYKIGYDPYAQDEGSSLAAIYVYKGVEVNSFSRNMIVAQYVGRPKEADDANRMALMFALLYNTEVMHENMFIHVKNYFRRKKALDRLASQPDRVISKNIKESVVSRIYGIHMNEQLKDAGEKYIKDWLLDIRDYDEQGNPVYNYEFIYDAGLLQELIKYNRKDNFDRIMSLMQVMFQVQEDIEAKYDASNTKSPITEWTDYLEKKLNGYG